MDKASVSGAEDCGFESHRRCFMRTHGLVGYDVCFTRRRSRVRSSVGVAFAWLQKVREALAGSDSKHVITKAAVAQLGERQTEDLKVPGSIPGGGICFF